MTGDTRWSGKQKTKTDPRASGPVLNVPASILLLIFRAFGPVNSNPVLSGSDIQSHNFRSCIFDPRHLFLQIPILYFPAATLIWCRTVSAPACPVRNISTVIAPRPTTELRGGSETRKLRCEQGIKQVRAKAATPGGTVPVVVRRLSVCLSVTSRSSVKTGGWIELDFGVGR